MVSAGAGTRVGDKEMYSVLQSFDFARTRSRPRGSSIAHGWKAYPRAIGDLV